MRSRDHQARSPLNQVLGDIIALTYADARELAEPSRMAALERALTSQALVATWKKRSA